MTAKSILSQATVLNNSATLLESDATMASDDVKLLEQVLRDDTEAISMVSNTANETIITAANLSARLVIVKVSFRIMHLQIKL